MKIIYLTGVFLRWCYNDILENYQDIKFRYWMETSKEGKKLTKDIESTIYDVKLPYSGKIE
jgi:hypothetical protein